MSWLRNRPQALSALALLTLIVLFTLCLPASFQWYPKAPTSSLYNFIYGFLPQTDPDLFSLKSGLTLIISAMTMVILLVSFYRVSPYLGPFVVLLLFSTKVFWNLSVLPKDSALPLLFSSLFLISSVLKQKQRYKDFIYQTGLFLFFSFFYPALICLTPILILSAQKQKYRHYSFLLIFFLFILLSLTTSMEVKKDLYFTSYMIELLTSAWPLVGVSLAGLLATPRTSGKLEIFSLFLSLALFVFVISPYFGIAKVEFLPYLVLFFISLLTLRDQKFFSKRVPTEIFIWFFIFSTAFNVYENIYSINYSKNNVIQFWGENFLAQNSEYKPIFTGVPAEKAVLNYLNQTQWDNKFKLTNTPPPPPYFTNNSVSNHKITYYPLGVLVEVGRGAVFARDQKSVTFQESWTKYFKVPSQEGRLISQFCIFNSKKGLEALSKNNTNIAIKEFKFALESNPYCYPALQHLCFLKQDEYCSLEESYKASGIINYFAGN